MRPIYIAPWNQRLRSMEDFLIGLYREGTISEGQVSKATGLDRITCRDKAIQKEIDKSPQKVHVALAAEACGDGGQVAQLMTGTVPDPRASGGSIRDSFDRAGTAHLSFEVQRERKG